MENSLPRWPLTLASPLERSVDPAAVAQCAALITAPRTWDEKHVVPDVPDEKKGVAMGCYGLMWDFWISWVYSDENGYTVRTCEFFNTTIKQLEY